MMEHNRPNVFCLVTLLWIPLAAADINAAIDDLALLKTGTVIKGQSSFDRTGGNGDFDNFLGTDDNGDKIILDAQGPGAVYRMWFTGTIPSGVVVNIYFDNETTPAVNEVLMNLFTGSRPPFLPPLVGTNTASSGGFYTYVPIPFAKSIRITLTNPPSPCYYNINYHVFTDGREVTTWTGNEDLEHLYDVFGQTFVGVADPKKPSNGEVINSSVIDLQPNTEGTPFQLEGPGIITSLKLSVPGLINPASQFGDITDNGRAHVGYSEFILQIYRGNNGALLERRVDVGIHDQVANVYVDSLLVGVWTTMNGDSNTFQDSKFFLPSNVTSGKTELLIRIEFISSSIDWNEFAYRLYSITADGLVLTDTVDVGDQTSEIDHQYVIFSETWTGNRTYFYPVPIGNGNALNAVRLRITYDNDAAPSVDAPIGSFFGLGELAISSTRSLLVGLNNDNQLYSYFPIPFQSSAQVSIFNQLPDEISIAVELKHAPFQEDFSSVGYFNTYHNVTHTDGEHVSLLTSDGPGHVVGVTVSLSGPEGSIANRGYLEGDEFIYVDGDNTPVVQGTGTEDFFNGGWYFNNGPFSLPTHGNTAHQTSTRWAPDRTSAYRLFITDVIPFDSHIQFDLEPGIPDVVYSHIVYYYQKRA